MFNSFLSLEKSVSFLALTVSLLSPSISFAMERQEPSVLGKRKLEVTQEGESSEGGQRSAKRRKLEHETAEAEKRFNSLKSSHLQARHNSAFTIGIGEELTKVLKALKQENDRIKFSTLVKNALLHAHNINRLTEENPTYEWDICGVGSTIVHAYIDRNDKQHALAQFKLEDIESNTSGAGQIGAEAGSLSVFHNNSEREWEHVNMHELLEKVGQLFSLDDKATPSPISGAGLVGVGAGAGSLTLSQAEPAKEEVADEEDSSSVASASDIAQEEKSWTPEQKRIKEELLEQIEKEKVEIEELNTQLSDLNGAVESQGDIAWKVGIQAKNINEAIDFVRDLGKKKDEQDKVLLQQLEGALTKTASLTKARLENYERMVAEGTPERDKLQDLIVRKERNLIDLIKRAQALGSEIEDYVPFQLGNAPDPDLENEVGEESLSASSGLGLPVLGAGAGSGSGSGLGLPVFGAGAGAKSSSAPGSH